MCNLSDEVLAKTIGTIASDEAIADLQMLSGATEVVRIRTGDPIVSNYRDNRLIVVVGPDGKFADIFCS
jgi:hypothetical protein